MRFHRALLLPLALALAAPASAQGEGGDRTKVDLVFSAFREADSVRRIERAISSEARDAIESALPFRVHFAELGTHVLFVAFRGRKPIGLLYVRSEETAWGLADIAWAIDVEAHITGFEFVNSRSDRARALPQSPFGRGLVGLTLADLTRAQQAAPAVEGKGTRDELEGIVERSAMMATAVITIVWADEVQKLADLAMLYDEFPGAERFRRFLQPAPESDGAVTRGVIHVMEALARGHFELGSAIATTCRIAGRDDVVLRWVLDSRGRIVRVTPQQSWAPAGLRALCSGLAGRQLGDAPKADNPLTQAANEIAEALDAARRGKAKSR